MAEENQSNIIIQQDILNYNINREIGTSKLNMNYRYSQLIYVIKY